MDKVVHVEGLEDRVDCCIQLACLFSRFTLVFCKIFGVLFCEIFRALFWFLLLFWCTFLSKDVGRGTAKLV